MLLETGISIDSRDAGNATALHYATKASRLEAICFLLEHDADANAVTSAGYTPLMMAAASGDTKACTFLVSNGAEPDLRSNKGFTAREIAQSRGHFSIVSVIDNRFAK